MIYKVSTAKREKNKSYVSGESADGRRLDREEYTSIQYNTLIEACYGVEKVFVNRYTAVVIPEKTKHIFFSTEENDYNTFRIFGECFVNIDTGEVSKDYGQLVSPSPWRTPEYNQDLMDLLKRSIK